MITSIMIVLDIFLKLKTDNYSKLHELFIYNNIFILVSLNGLKLLDSTKDKVRKLMIIFIWINSVFWSVTPLIGNLKIFNINKYNCNL